MSTAERRHDDEAPRPHDSATCNDPLCQDPACREAADRSTKVDREALVPRIVAMLESVYDPEIPVNIWELGLIYGIDVSDEGDVTIRMTLTAPNCPVAGSLPIEVEMRVASIPGVRSCRVELTWDPPWTPDRMSETARLMLGLD